MFPCNELDLLLYCLWLWLTRADKEAFSALPPSPAPACSGSISAHCSPGWGSLVKEYMESLPGSMVEATRDKMANGHCPTTPASTLRSGENKSTVATMDNTDTGSQQGNSRKNWSGVRHHLGTKVSHLLNDQTWKAPSLHLLMRTKSKERPKSDVHHRLHYARSVWSGYQMTPQRCRCWSPPGATSSQNEMP